MADPVTIGLVGVSAASALGGGLLAARGAQQKGSADASLYNYQAGIADLNKKISAQNADYSRWTGEVSAQEAGMKARYAIGETKAAQGASNLDVNTGSQAAVRDSEHQIAAQDQQTIRANAARKAFGYETEEAQYDSQGQIYRGAAKQAKTAGNILALGSLIGTAGSVSSKWLAAKQTGLV